MNILRTLLLLLLPFSLSPATRPFSGATGCEEAYDVKIYHWAAVIHSEARGESYKGKIAVLDALRNGAHGYKVGKLDPELVELVVEGVKKDVGHPYRHWINFDRATDKRQIRLAKKAMRDKNGIAIGNHFFY